MTVDIERLKQTEQSHKLLKQLESESQEYQALKRAKQIEDEHNRLLVQGYAAESNMRRYAPILESNRQTLLDAVKQAGIKAVYARRALNAYNQQYQQAYQAAMIHFSIQHNLGRIEQWQIEAYAMEWLLQNNGNRDFSEELKEDLDRAIFEIL